MQSINITFDMINGLYTPEEVSRMILTGDRLLLAGDAGLLSRLPKGNWIGTCTPRFILYPDQGIETYEKIFATKLPDFITETTIREYDTESIKNIFNEGPKNGFTILFMPLGSPIAIAYMLHAMDYDNFAVHPICGCISGEPGCPEQSSVFSGTGPYIYPDKAVAMHISLPEGKYAEIQTFNPYKQGTGDSVVFDYSGLVLEDAYINGEKRNFAQYLNEIKYDWHLPFVANYSGEIIIILLNKFENDKVLMHTPVLKNVEYRMATIDDSIPEPVLTDENIFFSVACISNYVNPEIRARFLKKMNGPVVYGEIAYQQVWYTTVYLTIDDIRNKKQ